MICFFCKKIEIKLHRRGNAYTETWVCNNKNCVMHVDHREISTWIAGHREIEHSIEDIEAVKKLRHQGYTQRQIAEKTGIPKSTIGRWVR